MSIKELEPGDLVRGWYAGGGKRTYLVLKLLKKEEYPSSYRHATFWTWELWCLESQETELLEGWDNYRIRNFTGAGAGLGVYRDGKRIHVPR